MSRRIFNVVAVFMFVFSLYFVSRQSCLAADRETLKFGVVGPMSGGGAEWGIAILRACEVGADKINREGGIKAGGKVYDLKIIGEDGKISAEASATAANKLTFQDGAKFQFYMASVECLAAQAITEANNVLTLTASYAARAIGPDHPWTFRVYNSALGQAIAFYKWLAKDHPKVKRLAILSRNDETGWEMEKMIKTEAVKNGMEVVAAERYDLKLMDFYPTLTKVLPKKPDIIDTGSCPMNIVATVAKQGKEMGYKGMIGVSGSPVNAQLLIQVGGKQNVQGIVGSCGMDLNRPDATPRQKEFYQDNLKKYREEPLILTPEYVDMVWMLKAAIEKVNSIDPAKVRDVLADPSFSMPSFVGGTFTFGGEKTYGARRQMVRPIVINEVVGDTYKTIAVVPIEIP